MRPLLVTWYLWRRLWQLDFEHSIFRWYRQRSSQKWINVGVLWAGSGVLFLLLMLTALILSPSDTLFLVMLMAILAPLLLLALNAVIFGILFTLKIVSGLLAYNRLPASEIIRLTAIGSLNLTMMVASARLHQNNRLYRLNRFLRMIVGVGVLACVLVAFIITMGILGSAESESAQNSAWQWLISLIPIASLFLLLYVDHVQSVVVAVLCAMVATHVVRDSIQVRVSSVFFFLSVQFIPYLLSMAFFVILRLIMGLYWGNILIQIIVTVGSIVLLYLLRESFIAACWRWLMAQYDVTPDALSS
jgi:hypothetical protein